MKELSREPETEQITPLVQGEKHLPFMPRSGNGQIGVNAQRVETHKALARFAASFLLTLKPHHTLGPHIPASDADESQHETLGKV